MVWWVAEPQSHPVSGLPLPKHAGAAPTGDGLLAWVQVTARNADAEGYLLMQHPLNAPPYSKGHQDGSHRLSKTDSSGIDIFATLTIPALYARIDAQAMHRKIHERCR